MPSRLSASELNRYSRHVLLPQVGVEGQERLKGASVLIIGAGGLGSPSALYLAAAGVGRLGLVDFDVVEESNLQRQIIHDTSSIGKPKIESARERISRLTPLVQVDAYSDKISADNIYDVIAEYDLVVDGTDNFTTRYAVNDACVNEGKPYVYASISQFEGQASLFGTPGGPCYRCLFPEPPPAGLVPSCSEGGVLGVLPGLLGVIQATEALKWILGIGDTLAGRLLLVDLLTMQFRELSVPKDPACPVCGTHRPAARPTVPAERPPDPEPVPELSAQKLAAMQSEGDAPFLLDVRRPEERALADLGGALIPLHELPLRLAELESVRDNGRTLVVYCRTGGRSAQAVRLLHAAGFPNAVNLRGGLHAWSDAIDPSLPKY